MVMPKLQSPDLVYIPDGPFIMGSIPDLDDNAFEDEVPIHAIYLADYFISRYPITNAEYEVFVIETGYVASLHWKQGKLSSKLLRHPVQHLSLYDAIAYCDWLSKRLNRRFRLPSEAEWEKAARGQHAYIYPWGYKWKVGECNTSEIGIGKATPVDQFAVCPSPYGVVDMCGNVGEWTISLWEGAHGRFQYPYDFTDGREALDASPKFQRVIRGGSFLRSASYARCVSRSRGLPDRRQLDVGFRIVTDEGY